MAVLSGRPVKKRVLVVGGGVAGTAAALQLNKCGFEVVVAERAAKVGGHAGEMGCKATDKCLRCNVCVADSLFRDLGKSKIKVMTLTELDGLEKRTGGGYKANLKINSKNAKSIEVDAVVMCTGYEGANAAENVRYGFGHCANIIDGLQAEKQLADNHRITRPSDGKVPAKMAFIQCVGSRTEEVFRCPEGTDYCSVVCCAYATRMARRVKHDNNETQVKVFYMDIQNFGKDFDAHYTDCREKCEFVRSRPFEVRGNSDGSVTVKYATGVEKDQVAEETFGIVVLSTGIRPAADAAKVAEKAGVMQDEYGFFGVKDASGLSQCLADRVWAAGACTGPKDIAGSIAQAQAVCAAVMAEV